MKLDLNNSQCGRDVFQPAYITSRRASSSCISYASYPTAVFFSKAILLPFQVDATTISTTDDGKVQTSHLRAFACPASKEYSRSHNAQLCTTYTKPGYAIFLCISSPSHGRFGCRRPTRAPRAARGPSGPDAPDKHGLLRST